MRRDRDVREILQQSAMLRARLDVLFEVIHETAASSRGICDNALVARVRARRTTTRER